MRVEILHKLALEHHNSSEERKRKKVKTDEKIIMDMGAHSDQIKQSCIVGMIIVWSVITLEALANQALAETIECESEATNIIEYPKKPKNVSQLARKIHYLSRGDVNVSGVVTKANELCDLRNIIVHDKPFNYICYQDGEVEIDYFSSKGAPLDRQLTYNELSNVYHLSDEIRDYLLNSFDSTGLEIREQRFASLLES